jgi:hypothetical protein
MQFKILSLPTLLSTLWCWLPLSYLIFHEINKLSAENDPLSLNESSANPDQVKANSSEMAISFYIYRAFETTEFAMILLLPATLGHFFACNGSKLKKRFVWSQKCWLVVFSAIIFMVTDTASFFTIINETYPNASTWETVHRFLSVQLMNVITCFLHLTALLLVSSRQADFIKKAAKNSKMTLCSQINDILQEYEYIKCGCAPLYTVEFCLHAPIILYFAYFGISFPEFHLCLWSSGKIAWSSLTLIHICLMSEDCYAALQNLVPAIG